MNSNLQTSHGIEETNLSTQFGILCVDDETNILSALRRMLNHHGYKVYTANSAQEAIVCLEKDPIDLIISDMRMPEMDGAAFLEIAFQRWPEAGRLLLTGFADVPSIVKSINKGQIHRYITKPWNEDELLLTVRNALQRVALEREKKRLERHIQLQNANLQKLNEELESKVLARTAELDAANIKLKKNYLNSIKTFSNLLEMRGVNMRGHARAAAELARRTAVAMSLPESDQQDLFVAALLHDVGQICLPDRIISCPVGRMDKEDVALYKKHPALGEMALMAQEDMQGISTLIRNHHERYDGQGYPDGLSGNHLSKSAHILIVVEAYLDMQAGHLSQAKLDPTEARTLLAHGRGVQFDPEVVDVFLQITLDAVSNAERPSRTLKPSELQTGMVLSEDLLNSEGIVLLAAEQILTQRVIELLKAREQREKVELKISVHLTQPK